MPRETKFAKTPWTRESGLGSVWVRIGDTLKKSLGPVDLCFGPDPKMGGWVHGSHPLGWTRTRTRPGHTFDLTAFRSSPSIGSVEHVGVRTVPASEAEPLDAGSARAAVCEAYGPSTISGASLARGIEPAVRRPRSACFSLDSRSAVP